MKSSCELIKWLLLQATNLDCQSIIGRKPFQGTLENFKFFAPRNFFVRKSHVWKPSIPQHFVRGERTWVFLVRRSFFGVDEMSLGLRKLKVQNLRKPSGQFRPRGALKPVENQMRLEKCLLNDIGCPNF